MKDRKITQAMGAENEVAGERNKAWQPIPLVNVLAGRIILGCIVGIFTFLLSATALAAIKQEVAAFTLVAIVFISVLATETLSGIFARYYANKHRHEWLTGLAPAVFKLCCTVVIFSAVSYVFTRSLPATLAIAGCAIFIEILVTFLLKTWRKGKSRAEREQTRTENAEILQKWLEKRQQKAPDKEER
ncbi:MAG: hypothetical protein Q4C71_01830 [Microbacteriaceae bacterium]|nr:hypothetical protein [Microbacteriaceae bacterium]